MMNVHDGDSRDQPSDGDLRPGDDESTIVNAPSGDSDTDPDATVRHVRPPSDQDVQLASAEQPGQTIDRYRLIEPLGEGGFGTVWLAEQQEPVRRQVALKVIKLGMDTRQVIARFEAERQALAVMDHPNIAKVFDAGATATGRPYFVMELVKGVPIVEYCDREQLDTRQRLDLFVGVCRAIQHAHQKGIIHRDIKPTNVLVVMEDDCPVPKVIDFGIAKATDTEQAQKTLFTEHNQIIGTPAYMSPEQAAMDGADIDTRSDIYALGVLLYEMLVGTTPFDARDLLSKGFAEMMRVIREEEPRRPSTRLSELGETAAQAAALRRVDVRKLSALLRGDLDWIVMKCLEKDRTRRYETAAGLAEDIARHLDDQPVTAGPPSARYRMRKFVRRNRGRVVAASVVAAALVLGVVGTSVGLAWALREKERAVAAEAETEQVAVFQALQLSEIDPQLMGDRLRVSLLAKLRDAIEARSLDEAAISTAVDGLEASMVGVNFTTVSLEILDENFFQRTLAAIEEQFDEQPRVKARLLQTLAHTARGLGLLDRAVAPQAEALEIRRTVLGEEHPETLASFNAMGWLLQQQGKLNEAESYARDGLAASRRVLGDDHPDTIVLLNALGTLLFDLGRYDEAEPCYREALQNSRRVLGDDHPSTLNSINNMGSLLYGLGKLDEAESYYREALDGNRRVFGDDHSGTLNTINNMASLLYAQGRYDEAESYFREALASSRRVHGDDHPDVLNLVNNLGSLLFMQGKLDEAESYFREALAGRRRTLGDDHLHTLVSSNAMGRLLTSLVRLDEAEPYLRETLAGFRKVLGNEHPTALTTMSRLGSVLHATGKQEQAEPYYRESLAGRRRVLGDDHSETLTTIAQLSVLLRDLGRLEEAQQLGAEAVAGRRRSADEDPQGLGSALSQHAQILILMDRFTEAERNLLEAQAFLVAAADPACPFLLEAVDFLVDLYDTWHASEPGAGYDAKAAQWRARSDGRRGDASD